MYRILDAKVEHLSADVQNAVEGSVTAESRCNALGVELVKVFRMIATSSKGSPAKSHDLSRYGDSHVATGGPTQKNNENQITKGTVPPLQLLDADGKKIPVRQSAENFRIGDIKSNRTRKTFGTSGSHEGHSNNKGSQPPEMDITLDIWEMYANLSDVSRSGSVLQSQEEFT
eukprot:Gb_27843 [translate_table: standard]